MTGAAGEMPLMNGSAGAHSDVEASDKDEEAAETDMTLNPDEMDRCALNPCKPCMLHLELLGMHLLLVKYIREWKLSQ